MQSILAAALDQLSLIIPLTTLAKSVPILKSILTPASATLIFDPSILFYELFELNITPFSAWYAAIFSIK